MSELHAVLAAALSRRASLFDALAAEGIDAHARAERYRSLLQFFGPYVPIEILVPTAQRDDAVGVIERVLAGETDAEEA